MQSLTFTIFTVSKELAMLKFLPHTGTQLAGCPNADHHTDSYFSCKSKNNNCTLKIKVNNK